MNTFLFPLDPGEQADRLFTQAMEWLRAGQLQAARGLLEQAVQLNREQGRVVPQGYAHLALGRVALELGEVEEARNQLQAAAEALAAGGDRIGQVRLFFELGELAERQGDLPRAIEHYQTILDLDEGGSDQAVAHLRLGAIFRDRSDVAQALPHYAAAQAAFAETGNELGEARAMLERARLAQAQDPGLASELFARGLALAEAYAQDDLAAVAHLGLGQLSEDGEEARHHLTQAVGLASEWGDLGTAEAASAALDALSA